MGCLAVRVVCHSETDAMGPWGATHHAYSRSLKYYHSALLKRRATVRLGSASNALLLTVVRPPHDTIRPINSALHM
jgi:predicted transglutaminase-like cysteine proteinase